MPNLCVEIEMTVFKLFLVTLSCSCRQFSLLYSLFFFLWFYSLETCLWFLLFFHLWHKSKEYIRKNSVFVSMLLSYLRIDRIRHQGKGERNVTDEKETITKTHTHSFRNECACVQHFHSLSWFMHASDHFHNELYAQQFPLSVRL